MLSLFRLVCISSFLVWTSSVHAHSWLDCIDHSYDVVYTRSEDWVLGGTKGNGACEGYAYNYPGRGDPNINTAFTYKLLPDQIRHDDLPVCQYPASGADYSGWRHRIHAKPGDKLYFAYFANGHTVKDKAGRGTNYGIYWSGQPNVELHKPSELTIDRLVDGQLHDFDDGNCGETYADGTYAGGSIPSGRAGDYKPCIGSFTIPHDTKAGTYPMVWWWTFYKPDDFATNFVHFEGAGGAAYSSCFDVIVECDENVLVADPTPAPVPVPETVAAPVQPIATPAPTPAPTVKCTISAAPVPSIVATSPMMTPVPFMNPAPVPVPVPVAAPMAQTQPETTAPPSSAPVSKLAGPVNPIASVTIDSVGGAGVYGRVTNMACSATANTCDKTPVAVDGPLAPFDEDLTLAFRGPMEIDQIAVYGADAQDQWTPLSSYDRQSQSQSNLVFLNNKGDAAKSGEFSMCHGNSQSFATFDSKTSAPSSQLFNGVLDDGVELNIMADQACTSGNCNGFGRGVAYKGWEGETKIFMVKAKMPHTAGTNMPAIWFLNGQIVRSAQFGCNCRGMGGDGGCGELDIAEVIAGDLNGLSSTIYSFKGSRGTNTYAPRPVEEAVVFVTIFHKTSSRNNDLGRIQILVLKEQDVDLTQPPSPDQVNAWLHYDQGVQVDFDI